MIFIDHFQKVNTDTVFTINTTIAGSSDNKSIIIPAATNFYGEVFWGDGTSNVYTSGISINLTKTYAIGGVYTIAIKMNVGYFFKLNINNTADKNKFTKFIRYGDGLLLSTVALYGAFNFDCTTTLGNIKHVDTTLVNCFRGYPFAKINNIENLDVSGVLNMNSMFQSSLFNHDISMWNFNKDVTLLNFMSLKTSANYNATYYSNLLNKFALLFIGTGRSAAKTLGMGSIKYDSSGSSARAALVADGWTITDGGLI